MKEWCLEVWGDYACFTRPEMKVERVSYDVMTPSAARAIFEAILWKPAIRWNVTKIEVLQPIKWVSVRRNEVSRKMSGPTIAQLNGESTEPMGFFADDSSIRQQRASLFLRDVRYRIHAWFEFIPPEKRKYLHGPISEIWADGEEKDTYERSDENEAKYAAMFSRRAQKGQCFHRPYLGCREFACDFKLINGSTAEPYNRISESRDLGFMLYDLNFEDPDNPQPLFFRAEIKDGVIIVPERSSEEVRG
ncbi:MAG: type I-C CRISPR-associated protein Cas5 [Chitinivibrionales bacterium]|nr:type I-C CRISPR-associated protein Cas5 [Chitinivibrionales bacterium]